MQYVELGRSGLRVSRLCLGTMNFGELADEKAGFAMMDRALELGINLFMTSNRYGLPRGTGLTEQIIGRWLALGDRRERIVLATKVYGPMGPGPNNRGLSAYHIRRACEDSLRRLRTDHIDLYQMHHVDRGDLIIGRDIVGADVEFVDLPGSNPGPPWEEIWQAMDTLVMLDKVSYIGSSNFAAWNIVQACETARARGSLGLVVEESVYNLLNRNLELEVIPACRAYGVGVICWSPLAGGLLAGSANNATAGRRGSAKPSQVDLAKAREFEVLCRDLGEQPADVALAWLLRNPAVTAPIVGPRTIEQLDSSIGCLQLSLPDEFVGKLDRLFPGPGEAPGAYAW